MIDKISFKSQVVNIYIWRLLSLLSGFFSLIVVIPHLSLNQELYGIYTFCMAFNLYLTYADIGFLSAGQKYAAEEYAKGNIETEITYLGFTGFVLLCMVLPFSITMVFLSFHPEFVLSDLSLENKEIARKFLLLIGVMSPIQVILQRLTQSILIIRIKDYISLRIEIVFNLLKIFSVYYFFSSSNYLIVEYFIFINLLTIVSSIIVVFYIRSSENYNFFNLIKSIKFDNFCYGQMKKLAFSSLFLTFSYIIYFELDLVIIGKFFGPNEVAIYAIGFTLLNFTRNLWNIIYGPFSQKFNHYVALNDVFNLRILTSKLISFTFPISVLSVILLVISAKYIVISWVGMGYIQSILIFQILILGSLFNFVQQPSSYYFISTTNYRYLNLSAFVTPFIFIISFLFLFTWLGVIGLAVAKILAIIVSSIISFFGIKNIVDFKRILREWYLSILVNSIVIFVGLNYALTINEDLFVNDEFYLFSVLGILFVAILVMFVLSVILNKSLKSIFSSFFSLKFKFS
jgi:O-antigen/teichoic acid export membrane protein